ncbi:MAG: ABC transporter substrate-binding protein [Desulfurella sp.]|uniref:ABC transporter substrate-binding protein n=1 Tax=Desulfurella sp. TaxID=1962857 RepID=UPI003D0FB772
MSVFKKMALIVAVFAFVFLPRLVFAAEPINIGIIAEQGTLVGDSIVNGAKLAADQINAKGGIDGRPIKLFIYDDHMRATDAVQAFQRAVYDHHVVAVIGSWISEVALALEPWAARLHTIYITTGAANPKITEVVHNNYNMYKYVFQLKYNATEMAQTVCNFISDDLVKQYGYKTAFVASENAAWTEPLDAEYLKCLPQTGIKVVGHMRFAPNTTDFTPIFTDIKSKNPDLLVTGWAHTGLQQTVQWHEAKYPFLIVGINAQASTSDFWKKSNGATEGIISQAEGSPAPITPKTIPFVKEYEKVFGITPAYGGYTTYDAIYVLAQAIKRAKSTNTDALIKALEATNYIGVMGHIEFYGKESPYAHGIKYGPSYATGVLLQWQHGKLETVWPPHAATAKVIIPSFVKK